MIKIGTVNGDVIEKGGIKNVSIIHNYYNSTQTRQEESASKDMVTDEKDVFCLDSLIEYITPLQEICKPDYRDKWLELWQKCIQDEDISASIRIQGKTAIYQIVGTLKPLFFPSSIIQRDIDSRLEPIPSGKSESKYRANLSKKYKLANKIMSIIGK